MAQETLSRVLDAAAPALRDVHTHAHTSADFCLPEGGYGPVLASLCELRDSVVLVITPTSREAARFADDLGAYADVETAEFIAWETLPHERLSPSVETVGKRLDVLTRLAAWKKSREAGENTRPFVIFASVRAALQPLIAGLDQPTDLTLRVDASVQQSLGVAENTEVDLAEVLTKMAYTRVDMVTRRGEFAVRGGILDVFSPDAEHAVRIDFFGDEVDDIRPFAVTDQRSYEDGLTSVRLLPARELLLTDAVRERAAAFAAEHPEAREMCEKIAHGVPVDGMEALAAVLVGDMVPLTSYLPDDAAVAVCAPERVATRAVHLRDTNQEFLEAAWNAAGAGGDTPLAFGKGDFYTVNELCEHATPRPWWTLSPFGDDDALHLAIEAVPSFAGDAEGALLHAMDRLQNGWRVAIATQGSGLAERAAQLLGEHGASGHTVDAITSELEPGVAEITAALVHQGFEVPDLKLAVLAEADFFGKHSRSVIPSKKPARRKAGQVVDPLQLKPGDIVVHEIHGVGRFVEMKQYDMKASGGRLASEAPRDYLVLEYASSKRGLPPDQLLVPTDQLDQLSRYVGSESPSLSKLGGSDWANTKKKARKAVRDIAAGLVRLYAERAHSKGYAFQPDTTWQQELEENFAYIETPDQVSAIADVKRDMENPMPMDRLISGDVGFGKTEIAVRAAFKAVQDGKQVAVLVPTTLLVKQHTETFAERFAGFPVQLRSLSRFQSDKEARETIDGLAAGTVDVVIGTHRLLSENVKYRDLGLIIVDEEQRFGVEHKDALKKIKTNVDVLAMSATPIPRTLEMAVTGLREMSQLTTPPEDRHPILTFVGPRNDGQIAAAIRRELLREGQVFLVHNRVQSISRVARQIQEAVPEARVAVAHGKLSENQLEQVVMDFYERKFDVLVTTTIIETGLDIANANTIIIDRADRYGLSQLHQLRGRVGRSRERAYAYFMYDADKPLSEQAHARLETIAKHNELGSGMQVAMKDLELRGAGNLLGAEQAGHIAGVGFDLYLRMVGEAIDMFKGETVHETRELTIEIPVDARIPESYIDAERLRLEAYQKLAAAAHPGAEADHIDLVRDELVDRYGEPPQEAEALIALTRLRRRAAQLGLARVVVQQDELRVSPVELATSRSMRLQRLYPGARVAGGVLQVPLPDGLRSGSSTGLRVSPLASRNQAADRAEDGNAVAWVDRLFTAVLDETAESGSGGAL